MSRIIILQHDGGEMGNQLWNYASIYAYGIERGDDCENWSFFEYAHYFKNVLPKSRFLRLFFFMPFTHHEKRRSAYRTQVWRKLYRLLVVWPVTLLRGGQIIHSNVAADSLYYLPPTKVVPEALASLEHSGRTLYFSFVSGGVFRNPIGVKKHREAVVLYFSPAPQVKARVHEFIAPLRQQYKVLIGVHLRQGDYAGFKNGKFKVSQERVCEILEEYCMQKGILLKETCFVITSDGTINNAAFSNLNIKVSTHNAGADLFILASCDAIIGSDSTFGNFASYYGDIPHIVIKNESMDWSYYADKNNYFINKYFTVMLN